MGSRSPCVAPTTLWRGSATPVPIATAPATSPAKKSLGEEGEGRGLEGWKNLEGWWNLEGWKSLEAQWWMFLQTPTAARRKIDSTMVVDSAEILA